MKCENKKDGRMDRSVSCTYDVWIKLRRKGEEREEKGCLRRT